MPQVKVLCGENRKEIITQAKTGENLFLLLQRIGVFPENFCGENGTCGKCEILFLDGIPEETAEDMVLPEEKLKQGFRLSCRHKVEKDCSIWIKGRLLAGEICNKNDIKITEEADTIVVDVGTTTLAAAWVRKRDGKLLRTVTAANSQRVFGSDVISRIKAANEGNGQALQELIWRDIRELCNLLGAKTLTEIVISANTVMEHLLLGYSCEGLGKAPFCPVTLALTEKKIKKVQAKVTFLPGISAFVGADIVSGLYAISMQKREKITLFIDLGTNGEMVLGTKNHMIATAASAGPAFEGAGISGGMPGIPGAISQVNFLGKRLSTTTIGGKAPIGICGTGILEAVCELYKAGIIGKNGTLQETYRENGYPLAQKDDTSTIFFTGQDVRQVQLAKSAIRSGIELLLKYYGITADEVDQVYLAGGFGQTLNVRKAVTLGLIPKKFEKKTIALGNTSLLGAGAYVHAKQIGKHPEADMRRIIENTTVLNLAELPEFEEYYMKYMNFGETV